MIDDKLVHEALQRFARTPDGRVFYVGLQKLLMAVVSSETEGALRENLGRRRFASELMAVMAEVMSEIKDSDDPRDRPIVFTLSKPVAGYGARGARRRVSATKPDTELAD
jgi:hypothetical protein